MTGIHNHYWCFLPNVYEAPPETEEVSIMLVDQDGYNTYSDCSGCKNYDQTPLMFVSGSSGALTKSTESGFEMDHLENIPLLNDGESDLDLSGPSMKLHAGNQARMKLRALPIFREKNIPINPWTFHLQEREQDFTIL